MAKNMRKIAYGSIMIVLGLIFGYVESMFDIVIAGVGLKVGISNIVTLICIYTLGAKGAFTVVLLRVILQTILFGNIQSFAFSFAGFILSFICMNVTIYLLKNKLDPMSKASVYIVSIVGGVMHNIGQLVVAVFMIKSLRIFYLLPIYLIAGLIAGLIVGIVSKLLLENVSILWYNKS